MPSLHFASRRYGYFEVLVQAYASPLSHEAHVSKRSIEGSWRFRLKGLMNGCKCKKRK